MNNLYKDDSIESLSAYEHVRLRPGMYAGDTSDPTQLAIEILGNAIDEYNIGHGNEISVDIKDTIITIADKGQGFPINVQRDDGETVLQASFDVINTSGKYRDDGVYEGTAIGLNGIGGKLTNFLSKKLTVVSYNNKGDFEQLVFIDGIFQTREVGNVKGHSSGTTVEFQPDPQFFDNPRINEKKLYQFCEDIVCLCPGLSIIYNGNKLLSENGIADLLSRNVGEDIEILNNPMIIQETKDKQSIALGMSYTTRGSSTFIVYVNCGITTGGPHLTSIKSCLTRVLNKWAKEQGILKKTDSNLSGAALQEGIVLVANITAENVAYEAQIKSNVTKIDTAFISSTLGEQLELWLDNNPDDGKAILEKALVARKAAEAAKKARERVKKQAAQPVKKKKFLEMPTTLIDANNKNRQKCELVIVEG